MAVAYVPAFLEDRATFAKERANGLYGPLPFMIANFIIGLPYLCTSSSTQANYTVSHISRSHHRCSFLHSILLALELPTHRTSLLYLDHVGIP